MNIIIGETRAVERYDVPVIFQYQWFIINRQIPFDHHNKLMEYAKFDGASETLLRKKEKTH